MVNDMNIAIRNVTIEDYDKLFELWNSTEQSRRALNPVDDSRDGIDRYLRRNPTTCFLACPEEDPQRVIGVILTGHDGRRAIIHHMCVHPEYRRHGIARMLLRQADIALYYVKDHGRDGCCFYSDALKGKTKPHRDT